MSETATTTKYLSPSQAAARLGVARTTVYGYIESGRLKGFYFDARKISIPVYSVESIQRGYFRRCQFCQKPSFMAKKYQVYCSDYCRLQNWRKRQAAKTIPTKPTCAMCPEPLDPSSAVASRFCSTRCYCRDYRRRNRKAINQKRRNAYVSKKGSK